MPAQNLIIFSHFNAILLGGFIDDFPFYLTFKGNCEANLTAPVYSTSLEHIKRNARQVIALQPILHINKHH